MRIATLNWKEKLKYWSDNLSGKHVIESYVRRNRGET